MALITTRELSDTAQVLIDIAPSAEFASGVAALALAKGAKVQIPDRREPMVVTVLDVMEVRDENC